MDLDLSRILKLTQRGQWSVNDIDWDQPLSDWDEISPTARKEAGWALLFTAGLERQAAHTFDLCSQFIDDPEAKRIYQLFREDELRHAEAETRLAARYGVTWEDLPKGARVMFDILERHREDPAAVFEFASSYILLFELALDTILMPSLKKLSRDPIQADVFRRIDQDESRHLAMDYWLLEKKGTVQKGKALNDVLPSGPAGNTVGRRIAGKLKLSGSLGTFLLGFGSMAFRMKELRGMMMDQESIDKYLELVGRVPKKAPHAMDVPAYVVGLGGQERILKLLSMFAKSPARSAAA